VAFVGGSSGTSGKSSADTLRVTAFAVVDETAGRCFHFGVQDDPFHLCRLLFLALRV